MRCSIGQNLAFLVAGTVHSHGGLIAHCGVTFARKHSVRIPTESER